MTSAVIYARYSTDRQNDLSIEDQIKACRDFAQAKGWEIAASFEDRGISGTVMLKRPGILQLLNTVKTTDIDVVLILSQDRLSRSVKHAAEIYEQLAFRDTKIWTVESGCELPHMENSMRALLSQEQIKQVAYRTRMGMRSAAERGKIAGGDCYGYRPVIRHDEAGERIPGLWEVHPEQAEVVRRIYRDYAAGLSPIKIACALNDENVPGPRGLKWRDTAIRGHAARQTGILNNTRYIGRYVFNRLEYRKDPTSERRIARQNPSSRWTIIDRPDLRIIDDELWERVKQQQLTVTKSVDVKGLNAAHRKRYFLSGILSCGTCGGSYSMDGDQVYACTNRKKKLPLDQLGGARCDNAIRVKANEAETRIFTVIPEAIRSYFECKDVEKAIRRQWELQQDAQPEVRVKQDVEADITEIKSQQSAIIDQMTARAKAGREPSPALDDRLDELQLKLDDLKRELLAVPTQQPEPAKMPSIDRSAIADLVEAIFEEVHEAGCEEYDQLLPLLRLLVSGVVVQPVEGTKGKKGEYRMEVSGRVATILAAAGEWKTTGKKVMENERLAAEHAESAVTSLERKHAWQNRSASSIEEGAERLDYLQMSVVAGAGFEPAAFRL